MAPSSRLIMFAALFAPGAVAQSFIGETVDVLLTFEGASVFGNTLLEETDVTIAAPSTAFVAAFPTVEYSMNISETEIAIRYEFISIPLGQIFPTTWTVTGLSSACVESLALVSATPASKAGLVSFGVLTDGFEITVDEQFGLSSGDVDEYVIEVSLIDVPDGVVKGDPHVFLANGDKKTFWLDPVGAFASLVKGPTVELLARTYGDAVTGSQWIDGLAVRRVNASAAGKSNANLEETALFSATLPCLGRDDNDDGLALALDGLDPRDHPSSSGAVVLGRAGLNLTCTKRRATSSSDDCWAARAKTFSLATPDFTLSFDVHSHNKSSTGNVGSHINFGFDAVSPAQAARFDGFLAALLYASVPMTPEYQRMLKKPASSHDGATHIVDCTDTVVLPAM